MDARRGSREFNAPDTAFFAPAPADRGTTTPRALPYPVVHHGDRGSFLHHSILPLLSFNWRQYAVGYLSSLQYFVQVELCGHATLAAAHFLLTGGVVGTGTTGAIEFVTMSGLVWSWS